MENRKRFDELEFMDSFMFTAVMEDSEVCRQVMERILGFPVKEVRVQTENSLAYRPDRRGVRLDVYADDENGTVYNVEMQTSDHRNLPKRSRFYQGQMDVFDLEPGSDFNTLPRSYVIFICTFDPRGKGLYRYTFTELCHEDGSELEDGTCKIFLNTKGKNDQEIPRELVRFLHYVDNPRAGRSGLEESSGEAHQPDPLIEKLQKRIHRIKRDRRMEERYMRFEEMLWEERREGQKEGRQEERTALLALIAAMADDNLAAEIPRLQKEPEFLKEMLEKYKIQ